MLEDYLTKWIEIEKKNRTNTQFFSLQIMETEEIRILSSKLCILHTLAEIECDWDGFYICPRKLSYRDYAR